jgi:hypothetical protein
MMSSPRNQDVLSSPPILHPEHFCQDEFIKLVSDLNKSKLNFQRKLSLNFVRGETLGKTYLASGSPAIIPNKLRQLEIGGPLKITRPPRVFRCTHKRTSTTAED